MNCFIGIDGGGTKTAFAIADENGRILHLLEKKASAYREQGIENACNVVAEGIEELLKYTGMKSEQISFLSLGLPAYGENSLADKRLVEQLANRLGQIPFEVVNDVVVGFWGALEMQPGIEIVAGTGSIAYGEDLYGNAARSGGWSEHFSDEGSCYWAGKKAMELFCKQADGRAPRGALYDLVSGKYKFGNDFDFVSCMEKEILVSRTKTAAFQRELLAAAQAGDESAIAVYREAARELFMMAKAVKEQLRFDDAAPVVVTGGMRHADEFLLGPLRALLSEEQMYLTFPAHEPVIGAVLRAQKKSAHRSLMEKR